jgi:ribose 5-phosphate isomerase B
MPYSDDKIRQIVRRVVLRTLNNAHSVVPGGEARSRPSVVTAEDVSQVEPGTEMQVPKASLVTPLARQVALERGVTFAPATSDDAADQSAYAQGDVVAIGCDHGGFEMKEQLKTYLVEMGYHPLDCGTHSKESVDYPDFAFAVARQVADGSAFRGIIIDGAGIGSCMAANKIPGVRAAMCYDQATAINSREHNNANVLTLGAGLIGHNLARQIVNTWLKTDFGGGRHGRRVNKIREIEQRYLKGR